MHYINKNTNQFTQYISYLKEHNDYNRLNCIKETLANIWNYIVLFSEEKKNIRKIINYFIIIIILHRHHHHHHH